MFWWGHVRSTRVISGRMTLLNLRPMIRIGRSLHGRSNDVKSGNTSSLQAKTNGYMKKVKICPTKLD